MARSSKIKKRRALNQYRLQDLPGLERERAAPRRVAAKGVRRDYCLLESHVHDADWPLKIPMPAPSRRAPHLSRLR